MTNESTKSPAEVLGADEWSELARLAESATQGEWRWEEGSLVSSDADQTIIGDSVSEGMWISSDENADFIAAANPATVLRLIHALRQASIRGGEA